MKRLADDKRSQPKEKIISIRVSDDQLEVFNAAMERIDIAVLSWFARMAMLDLAERILRPVDFTNAKLERDYADQKTQLKRKMQSLELDLAVNPENVNRHHVAELISLIRRFLSIIEELDQCRTSGMSRSLLKM